MRRSLLLAAALVLPSVPVLIATSADAAGENVICVDVTDVTCSEPAVSIPAAITAANNNSLDDIIWIGPHEYTDGPYQLNGTTHGVTLQGSGPSTVLTLPAGAAQEYVQANHATVRNLTVAMNPTTSTNDKGIRAFGGSVIENVTVDGTGTSDATAVQAKVTQVVGSSLLMPLGSGSRGMFVEGDTTITDSTITGNTGINHSGALTDTVSRSTIRAGSFAGVVTDSGTVDIDNSVIDLGTTGGTGLMAANFNNSASPKAINADHVTIVGGNGSSEGVWAFAGAAGAVQTTTVTLTNSIVRNPGKSLVASASNVGQASRSTATVTVAYTDYDPTTTEESIDGATGAGGVLEGAGNLDVAPVFVDAGTGDFRLSPGSPVIDKGNPSAGLPGDADLANAARVRDGDGNGSAIRDMGAFEVPDEIAPQTTITTGPSGPTNDTTPTFGFTSDPGATFTCQVDDGAVSACTSPFTTAVLTDGPHSLKVTATDIADNVGVAATRGFRVDTAAPDTTFTKKPGKQITKKRARFAFATSETGSTFQCRLDKGSWKSCASPKAVRVKKGRHVFRVRAIDVAGNVDATPAPYKFRRV